MQMTSSRDNWVRLVEAVIKKEQIWQLCHQDSITTVDSDFTERDLSLRSVPSSSSLPLATDSVVQEFEVKDADDVVSGQLGEMRMTSSRDNWVRLLRLVEAVIKKEQIWQLCHQDSITTVDSDFTERDLSLRCVPSSSSLLPLATYSVVQVMMITRMAKLKYKHRTIQRKDSNAQLRLLTCFHSTRNIPSLINLMEASRGTGNRQGLRVHAMHMMELWERSSAILMAHKARKNRKPFWFRKVDSDQTQIVIAFEAFQHLSQVSVRPKTAISSMPSMHVDICNGAAKKKVAMIILPFHKHQRLHGRLETVRADLRQVNRRVLEHAPCSVGIFIDRGLGGTAYVAASNVNYTVTTFFFGSHDDREALSYGALMAKHPGIGLNVVRFVVDPRIGGDSVQVEVDDGNRPESRSSDEEFLAEFKQNASKNSSIKFVEVVVGEAAEAVEAMRAYDRCNLFIVGRTPEGQLAAALKKPNECPELGAVGNVLISSEFSTISSVLVVQQYRSQLSGDSLNSLKIEDAAEESDSD